jgi:hypothetical protein
MAKLCKIAKEDLSKNLEAYIKLVDRGNYLCTKCGRVSNEEDYLCKAKKI